MAPPTAHMRTLPPLGGALPAPKPRYQKPQRWLRRRGGVDCAPQRDREAACCAATTGPPLTESDGCYQSSCRNSSAPGAASWYHEPETGDGSLMVHDTRIVLSTACNKQESATTLVGFFSETPRRGNFGRAGNNQGWKPSACRLRDNRMMLPTKLESSPLIVVRNETLHIWSRSSDAPHPSNLDKAEPIPASPGDCIHSLSNPLFLGLSKTC